MEGLNMILLEFVAEKRQEYTILRDYYVDRKDFKGIVFVVRNEENKEIFTRLLPESKINNEFRWDDVKQPEFRFETSGIERAEGGAQRLVIEYGTMKAEKRNAMGQKKPAEYTAKRICYLLK
jgi:hypothetical protein